MTFDAKSYEPYEPITTQEFAAYLRGFADAYPGNVCMSRQDGSSMLAFSGAVPGLLSGSVFKAMAFVCYPPHNAEPSAEVRMDYSEELTEVTKLFVRGGEYVLQRYNVTPEGSEAEKAVPARMTDQDFKDVLNVIGHLHPEQPVQTAEKIKKYWAPLRWLSKLGMRRLASAE